MDTLSQFHMVYICTGNERENPLRKKLLTHAELMPLCYDGSSGGPESNIMGV